MRYLLTALLLLPVLVSAQELHTFKNGEVADAEKINENFDVLNNKIESADASGGRPRISITTETTPTQNRHPFSASIVDEAPLFRVGAGWEADGEHYEIFTRILGTTPQSYVIDTTFLETRLGEIYELVVYAENIDGKAAVETVTVGQSIAIPLGSYAWTPSIPPVPDGAPVNLAGRGLQCWDIDLIYEFRFPVYTNYYAEANGLSCYGGSLPPSALPPPVPLRDGAGAVGCVSGAPIFTLQDLTTYGVIYSGTSNCYVPATDGNGMQSSGQCEYWREEVTTYRPGAPATLVKQIVDYCQYLPIGDSNPEEVQTFSRSFSITATREE